jgi:AcrR family transcriptional regulator
MARPIPPERFAQLIAVATKTFVMRGFRLTQMSDVADALGVAKGTLYGYVESKEALFDAVVRFADTPGPNPSALPLVTPPAGTTVRYIREHLLDNAWELELGATLRGPPPSNGATELEGIVRALYRGMAKNRRAMKVVDRCAIDFPELAALWFDEGRWALVAQLTEYLETRIAGGRLRPAPNVPLAARMVLETIALWAIHMPWDPSPRPFADSDVEDAIVHMLVHAHIKESPR